MRAKARPPQIAIFAGEYSGDLHAAGLVRAIRDRRPDAEFWGVGGAAMAEAGVQLDYRSETWSTLGYIQSWIAGLFGLHHANRWCQELLTVRMPDLVIFVDFGGFNGFLAKRARQLGLKTFWYVPPSSWSPKPRTAKKLAWSTDCVATPFAQSEAPLRAAGVNAHFVGHPLLDRVKPSRSREQFCRDHGLDPDRPLICYLPGSRRAELKYIWPRMAEAGAEVGRRVPGVQHVVGVAASVRDQSASFTSADLPDVKTVDAVYDAVAASDCVVTKAGTVTLEVALLGKPMAIVYAVSPVGEWEFRLFYRNRIRYIGMPNIILDEPACPEFIQFLATPTGIADYVTLWLQKPETAAPVIQALQRIQTMLGTPGAAQRAADLTLFYLP